jgi:ADP-ribose pyrophosphatase
VGFKRISSDVVYKGKIVTVYKDTVRYDDDGEEAEREYVGHPGSVAMVAHDGERVFLVNQPREPVGEQQVLELPAGKLDVEEEDPLATAKRELAEEIGKSAEDWELLKGPYYASVGFTNEKVSRTPRRRRTRTSESRSRPCRWPIWMRSSSASWTPRR